MESVGVERMRGSGARRCRRTCTVWECGRLCVERFALSVRTHGNCILATRVYITVLQGKNSVLQRSHAPIPPRLSSIFPTIIGSGASFDRRSVQHAIAPCSDRDHGATCALTGLSSHTVYFLGPQVICHVLNRFVRDSAGDPTSIPHDGRGDSS